MNNTVGLVLFMKIRLSAAKQNVESALDLVVHKEDSEGVVVEPLS